MEARFSHSQASLRLYGLVTAAGSSGRGGCRLAMGRPTYLYKGQPSASSRSLYLSSTRLSGPLLRIAWSGREPAGREWRSTMIQTRSRGIWDVGEILVLHSQVRAGGFYAELDFVFASLGWMWL